VITGAELRNERQRAGVSNVALAAAIGVNPSTITRIEQATVVREASARRYRQALSALAEERERSHESVRAAAEALISAGNALVETGRRLAGATADV
jgi:ribosome-binding protein aMBF1 (putative translation factor)